LISPKITKIYRPCLRAQKSVARTYIFHLYDSNFDETKKFELKKQSWKILTGSDRGCLGFLVKIFQKTKFWSRKRNFVKKWKFWTKIEIFQKNGNVGQKILILVKIQIFRKSKFWLKNPHLD